MQAKVRSFRRDSDYEGIGRFLLRTYRTRGEHINWLQPRWEYMHYHPLVWGVDLDAIGVWESDGEIVGVAHPEHGAGTVYFQVDPEYLHLKEEMLDYAEARLCVGTAESFSLRIHVHDADGDFQGFLTGREYSKGTGGEVMTRFEIPDPFPAIALPDGYHLQSLADDNDLRKVHRVLWRGFGHGDEPLEEGIDERRFMQSAPNFRKDLNIVVVAPGGEFAAYCGMWIESVNAVAYVEPVATDPAYRRRGLGKAAVLEGIRRCGLAGARMAYVGTDLPIYLSIGFRKLYSTSLWQRTWHPRGGGEK